MFYSKQLLFYKGDFKVFKNIKSYYIFEYYIVFFANLNNAYNNYNN